MSSANVLDEIKSVSKQDEGANDSVEVLTSLGSSHSFVHTDDNIASDLQLPTEEESVLDQVKRFHSSMEDETTNEVSIGYDELCTGFPNAKQ